MDTNNETSVSYTFREITRCNMCGSPAATHKLLGQRINQSLGLKVKSKAGVTTSVMKCDVCGLVYANPQPIPNQSDNHDFIEVWPESYFEYDESYMSPMISKVKELLNFQEGMKVLDIGAGIGKNMRALSNAGFDSFGVEPSARACQVAQERMGIDGSRIQCSTMEEADFENSTFDFISFGAVLEHVYDPAESLRISLKWLKPGGIIFAEIPNAEYFITGLMNFYHKLRMTNGTSHISPMHPPFHHFEFSNKSFEKFCEKNNCQIAHTEITVCTTPFVPRITVPILNWYMSVTNTGMQISVFLRK